MLKLRCKRHPRYSGVQSPRAGCEGCVYLWEVRNKAFERRLEIVEPKKPETIQKTDNPDTNDWESKLPATWGKINK